MNLLLRAAVSASSMVVFGCSDQQPTNLKPAVEVAFIEPAATNTAVDAATSASLPAYRDPVVQEWARYNSSCRGSASDKDACRARDTLTAKAEARGWCYGRGPGGGLDWVACDGPSPDDSTTGAQATWRFVRNEHYRDYEFFLVPRDRIAGREVEDRVMCKDMFQAIEDNMWLLQNVAIARTEAGTTTFWGVRETRTPALTDTVNLLERQMLQISFVRDSERNILSHLIVAGSVVGYCERYGD